MKTTFYNMNNKIFISGKVTGEADYKYKFEAAEVMILKSDFFERHGVYLAMHTDKFGYMPVNPTRLTLFGRPLEEYNWMIAMAVCLWKLWGCSTVYMLRDWKKSRGANIEHRFAKMLNKQIIYQQ